MRQDSHRHGFAGFVSEELTRLHPHYDYVGDSLISFSKADITNFQSALDEVYNFKSEVSARDIYDKISQLSDDVRNLPSSFQLQLDGLSRMVKLLSDTAFDNYMKIDGRLLADLLSQALLALKLISAEPTITNLTLVFTCCLTKLKLPDGMLMRCTKFIKGAIEVMVASIKTLGYKSEASLRSVVDVMTNVCGGIGSLVEDKVVDIVCHFIAKLIAFWTTVSGGFSEQDFNLSQMPLIVSKVRTVLGEGSDIIEALLGVYEWVTDNFPRFIKGDFSGLFFGKVETSAFETRVSKIKKMYPLVTSGSLAILKEEYGHTLSSYDSEVAELVKNADRMMKKAKDAQKPALKRMSDELREIQTDRMLKQAQVQTKMSAFGVCFVGGSGVGKSLLMEQTARTLIQAAGEVPSGDKIVSGQMSDKFDSNEMPHHLVIMYDDVANNSNNENYDKLLNAVNAQSRPFLKAAVEEKGIMFPGNIGCVISTNVPGYNAHKSNCPDSLGRRFLHIEVKIKPSILEEICVPGTKRIDPTLASAKGTRMDIWMFNVFEFVTFDEIPEDEMPEGIERWEGMYVRRLKWTDKDIADQTFWDLALFLKDRAKIHYASQKKLLDKLLAEQQEDFCKECCIPCSVCACHSKSEFFGDVVDLGIERLVDKYNHFCAWQREWWDVTKFRSVLAISIAMAPVNYYKTFWVLVISICLLSLVFGLSLLTTVLCILAFTPLGMLAGIIYAYRNLRHQLATRAGVLTHLAEESASVFRAHRDRIFVGAGLISFAYLLYRSFRPRSQFLNFREQMPEYIRANFARAEKARTTPVENIMPLMKRDLGKICVEKDGKVAMCLAFPIFANFYVTVGHMIPKEGEFCVTIIHESSLTPTVAKQRMSQNHIYRFPKKDLVLLNIPSAVPRKGYCDFLLGREVPLGDQTVNLVSYDLDSAQRYTSLTRMTPGWSMLSSTVKTDKVVLTKPYKYDCPIGTRYGMCGSLVVDHSKAIIYGFHVAGNGKVGLCDTLSREAVEEAIKSFTGFIPVNQGDLQLGSHTLEKGLGMVEISTGDPSVDKPISEHNCLVEGILPGASATFKSPYREHPYYKDVVDEFGPELAAPPQKINDPYHKRKALTKLTSPNQEFSLDEVEYAADDYVGDILKKINTYSVNEKKELSRVLTVQEALDGIGEKSLGGIDNSTSVGFPYKGKKMDYLERDPMDVNLPLTPRELRLAYNTDIEAEMVKMINIYKQEKSCRPLFKCSMKTNELLPKHKFKARVFMGSNFPFLLVCRRYLAPYVRMVSRNRFLFESAKGINMDSIEAEELYQFLAGNEERTVALDYSAFDQTMSAQVSTAVSGCIIRVMRQLGCSAEHILIARGILTDINYPNLHFFGTILQLANSDPSGNPITTELNGGVNSIYLRIFFFRIYSELKGKISYRQAIKTMTYGDDNINSVPKEYEKFNGTNIVAEGKKCGLTITMADKDADITDFTHLHESDFLKRKFRFCPDLGHIRAPLAKESITKSLYFMKNDSPEPPEILFAQNVDGALRKISQHGKEEFDTMRQKLLTIAAKHEVISLCKWWTYEELIDHDRKNYYDHYYGHSIAEVSDNGAIESDFISEAFVVPDKPKIDFTRIFTIIVDLFLSLIPFVKAGRYSDIKMTLRGYYGALSIFTVAHYFVPENFFGGDKARWLSLGHRLRSAFVDLWITQENDVIRPQPYCIVLEGPAGTGKTTCALALVKELFKNKGGIKKSEIVVLNEDDDFQSEFRSHHRVVIFDDVVNTKYSILTANPLRRLIDFVNNVPKRALNPEAELKGAIKIQPELVMVTTNVHGLGAYHLSNCADSIFRRAEFLQVGVKQGHIFSTDKLDVQGWILSKILKVKLPSDRMRSASPQYDYALVLNGPDEPFVSFYEAAKHYREDFERHTLNQQKLVTLVNDYFQNGTQFLSESWEGDIAWRLRDLPNGISVEEMKDIIISVAIEQAHSGRYTDLPCAFQLPPEPPTFIERWWYQIQLLFGLTNFKSEGLTFPQQASLRRYFVVNQYNKDMIVGANFCAILNEGRIISFHFHNISGVKEARSLCTLVDMRAAHYSFNGCDGYITSAECARLRNELAEEPEFRSEMRIFDADVEEVSDDVLTNFILSDVEFMRFFISNHVDTLIYQHYLFLRQKQTSGSFYEVEKTSDIVKAYKSPDILEEDSDFDIDQTLPHSAFINDSGFSELEWEGITLSKCPSLNEAVAQELAHYKMVEEYPSCKLVAREIVFDGLSFDLIYELDGEYIVLEAKGKGIKKCTKQSQKRYQTLKGAGIPVVKAYVYSDDTFRRVM